LNKTKLGSYADVALAFLDYLCFTPSKPEVADSTMKSNNCIFQFQFLFIDQPEKTYNINMW